MEKNDAVCQVQGYPPPTTIHYTAHDDGTHDDKLHIKQTFTRSFECFGAKPIYRQSCGIRNEI